MLQKKILLVGVLFLLAVTSFAQQAELSVQTGHSASIQTIAFSPGDDIIASAGDDNKIILWDFLTTKQFAVLLGHKKKVTGISFHPTAQLLISSSLDSTLKFWDIKTGKCLNTFAFKYPVHCAEFHPDGKSFAIGGNELALFTYPELTKQRLPIQPKKEFTCLTYSDDGAMIAFGGTREDLGYVVNLKDSILLKKIPASITDFKFDAKAGTILYCTSQGMAAEIGIYEKVKKKSTSTDWMLNSINSLELTSTNLYLANDNGEIYVYDRSTYFEQKILKAKKAKINCIQISNNGHYLASAGANRSILIWDLTTAQATKVFKGSVGKINAIAFSKDGKEILIGYEDGTLRKTNLITNQSITNSPQSAGELILSRFSYSVYEIVSFEKDSAVFTVHKKRHSLIHESVYDKILEYTVTWHFKENYLTLTEHKELSGQAKLYMDDLKDGIYHPVEFLLNPALTFAADSTQTKKARILNSELELFSQGHHLPIQKVEGEHSDRMTSVVYNNSFGFVATAGWDGMIRFRETSSGELLSTFGAFSGGQFIYINPEGYYFSSKKSLDYIGFKLDGKIYSFEQFDLKYNRPDLVAMYLPYYNQTYREAYKNAYEKRLKKMGISRQSLDASQNVPKLTYERNLDQLLLSNKIELIVTCSDKIQELDKLHIKVNGVPEFGRFGKSISGNDYKESVLLELTPGSNYIQLYTTNKSGVSSYHESFTIEAHKKDIPSDLYLISVGVSSYKQSQYNLNFARKDAEDVNRFFGGQYGLFNKVKTKLLVDSSVTLSNIYELKYFLLEAKPNDVVMVFIAGHGVLDNELDYYLASYDMDFKNPSEKGIPYEFFEELLDQTKSRKKVMFVDACHSGEIDKEEVIKTEVIESEQGDIKFRSAGIDIKNKEEINSFDLAKSLFADMRLNNGTTVVSSAGGSEYAIESENWRNGAFTYCMLFGLSSKKADLNGNKMILLSELQEYLLFEVNKLTNGQQTPTSRVENLNNDFRLN